MPFDLREQLQVTLGEAYRIQRELGGGGMSRVFLAIETALGREVVVKVLLPELAVGVSVARFRREIQVAAQLQHPHIVPLLSAGESAGLPYFTMPFVHGESLRARLLRDGELPVPDTIRVLRDVASALAYAHTQGVVHRDIKPDNVLLSHGVAVVTDFGVAKALTVSTGPDGETPGKGITSLGVTLGTPAYMAPEQASADPSMDHRVDIYSFGATAYELLTGQPVFPGRTAQQVLGAHVALQPTPVTSLRPGLPPLLAALIMKCLEKRPADRPQTAAEIIGALDTLTTPSGGTVPVPALHPTVEITRGGGGLVAARRVVPMVLLLTAVAVALWAWYRRAEAPPPASAIAPVAATDEPPAPPEPQPVAPAPAAPVEPVKPEKPVPAKPRPKAPEQPQMAADEKALLAQLGTRGSGGPVARRRRRSRRFAPDPG